MESEKLKGMNLIMIKFMEDSFDSYCGLESANCDYIKSQTCGGCIATKGQSFHGVCEIAECANQRNKRFCGECENFPCEILERYSHDKEHGDDGKRIERCKTIKSDMVNKARENTNPNGYCGHHCDFCFLKQWCGGCRSEYNCCSYATLYEDGVCPNVSCAKEKGLNSCGFCEDLLTCDKGFYGNEVVHATKAKALFIKNHNEDCYVNTLKRAMDSDENFAKIFDESKSVESAYKMLESYLDNNKK